MVRPMTQDQLNAETDYRYEERLAVLCGNQVPTELEKQMAMDDAREWLRRWQDQQINSTT